MNLNTYIHANIFTHTIQESIENQLVFISEAKKEKESK